MQRMKKEGIEWLAFDHLSEIKNLHHAVFLKTLDSSRPGYRAKIEEIMGIELFVSSDQVHGNEVVEVSAIASICPKCDALMTKQKHLGLIAKHADCQAAIIYDPIHHALATVHSGWRGSVKNVYKATLEKMKSVYGSRPENVLVGISPSLGPQKAEFRNYLTELPEDFWRFQVAPTYFDFWAISEHQLREAGVLLQHIEIAGICTYSNERDFFSYRRGDKTGGRHATVAFLK